MCIREKNRVLGMLMLSVMVPLAGANDLWDEAVAGDLSDDRFNPTLFELIPGDNYLYGILAGFDREGVLDRDYFTISVPEGYLFSAMILDAYFSKDAAAFVGIQPGSVFPDDPASVSGDDLLGWTLFGAGQQGQDILAEIGRGGRGFTPPLPAGSYTFWAQQFGDYTEWVVHFTVVPVPEPASVLSLALLSVILPVMHGRGRSRV